MVSIAIFWLSLDVGFKVILAGGIPNLSGPTLLGFDRANVNTTIPTERSQALFLLVGIFFLRFIDFAPKRAHSLGG